MLKKMATKILYILWLMRIPIVSVSVLLSMTALNSSKVSDFSGIIPLAIVIIAGYVQNDIYDVEIDRISAPSRPIPSGKVSVREAKILYGVLVVVGLIIGGVLSNTLFFLYLIVVLLFFLLYTRFCKTSWLIKNGFTALTSTTVVLIPIFFGGRISLTTIWLGMVAIFFTLGREIFMDVRDRNGDQVIPHVKRLTTKMSLFLAFFLLLISRVLREHLLGFSWYRMGGYLFVAALFYVLVNKRKTLYWYISEMLKIIFIIDLAILFIRTR